MEDRKTLLKKLLIVDPEYRSPLEVLQLADILRVT